MRTFCWLLVKYRIIGNSGSSIDLMGTPFSNLKAKIIPIFRFLDF
jgi:hypothetical protein